MPTVNDWKAHFKTETSEAERILLVAAIKTLLTDAWITKYYAGDLTSIEYAISSARSELANEYKKKKGG